MTGNDKNNDVKINKKGKLVVITGFSGSGKGSVLKELFKIADYKYSISATTRAPRNGEAHGVDYYFLSKEEFDKKISNNELLEYVKYSGNYYGTLRKPMIETLEAGYNIILEIEVEGALNIKEKFADALLIFITPPTYETLVTRLRNRATETEEIIQSRLEISKKEINYISSYDYFIINEDGKQKEAALEINAIVKGELDETSQHKVEKNKIEEFTKEYFKESAKSENIIKI